MDNNDKMLNNEESAFQTLDGSDSIYNKPTKAVPTPPLEIGIDTNNSIYDNIIQAYESSKIDMSQIESFSYVSQRRDQVYTLLDTMAEDSVVSAILETYAEDATEYNDKGQIVWAESSDSKIAEYVEFLLKMMNIDKNIYKWTHSLCKYGDLYVRLYRKSELEDPIFDEVNEENSRTLNEDFDESKNGEPLEEAVKIKAFSKNDKFSHYVEAVSNPAEMFELMRFGKTQGYIKADVGMSSSKQMDSSLSNMNYKYQFKQKDVEVFGATEFVHACLEDNTNRIPEKVDIYIDRAGSDGNDKEMSYTVRRGQSLLYNVFKIWRELMLLENSVILNRITKSSIVRVVGVEVGDMPKESVMPHLHGIKELIEQKSALNESKSMAEYTNPGPVENNIYVPTRNGIGAISTQQIGGDVDVKSLADLDYFKNKFYGAVRIPKMYFGETDDAAGFSGGQSLSIISARYAKMVKRIQSTLTQMITDIVNLMLLDRGMNKYVNNFTIHMLPPTTQEENDRRESLTNRVAFISDVMNTLTDIEDPVVKLKITKAMLANVITDTEVIDLIQEEIEKIEKGEEPIPVGGEEETDITMRDIMGDNEPSDNEPSGEGEFNPEIPEIEGPGEESEGETILPTPDELGLDLTDNNTEI